MQLGVASTIINWEEGLGICHSCNLRNKGFPFPSRECEVGNLPRVDLYKSTDG